MGAQQHQQRQQQHQPPPQQQQQSPGEHLGKAVATTIVPVVGIGGGGIRHRTTYSLDDVSTSSSAAPARSAFLNPWRELDREDFVITYATKGTARCIACASKIGKGELQVRLTDGSQKPGSRQDNLRTDKRRRQRSSSAEHYTSRGVCCRIFIE